MCLGTCRALRLTRLIILSNGFLTRLNCVLFRDVPHCSGIMFVFGLSGSTDHHSHIYPFGFSIFESLLGFWISAATPLFWRCHHGSSRTNLSLDTSWSRRGSLGVGLLFPSSCRPSPPQTTKSPQWNHLVQHPWKQMESLQWQIVKTYMKNWL